MLVISGSLTILTERRCLPQAFTRPEALLVSPATGEVLPTIIPTVDPGMATIERSINR